MKTIRLFAFFLLLKPCCQGSAQTLSHSTACATLGAAVVPIRTPHGVGSGYIVDPDGWIVTAAHVVIENGTVVSPIQIGLPTGGIAVAILKSSVESYFLQRDIAILKIEAKNLPSLQLGSELQEQIGADLTIIGFPWSAGTDSKFCLSGTIASAWTIHTSTGPVRIIPFQGISVKGLSGSPVISRTTGKVIGTLTVKLTGITVELEETKRRIDAVRATGSRVTTFGIDQNAVTEGLIDTLDNQLANGLGAATGASDILISLNKLKALEAAATNPTK